MKVFVSVAFDERSAAWMLTDAGVFSRKRDVYPHRKDLAERNFWVCWPCDA